MCVCVHQQTNVQLSPTNCLDTASFPLPRLSQNNRQINQWIRRQRYNDKEIFIKSFFFLFFCFFFHFVSHSCSNTCIYKEEIALFCFVFFPYKIQVKHWAGETWQLMSSGEDALHIGTRYADDDIKRKVQLLWHIHDSMRGGNKTFPMHGQKKRNKHASSIDFFFFFLAVALRLVWRCRRLQDTKTQRSH